MAGANPLDPLTDSSQWFRIGGSSLPGDGYRKRVLGAFWGDFGCFRLPDVPLLFPRFEQRFTTAAAGVLIPLGSFTDMV